MGVVVQRMRWETQRSASGTYRAGVREGMRKDCVGNDRVWLSSVAHARCESGWGGSGLKRQEGPGEHVPGSGDGYA